MPIWNWFQVKETNNLKYIYKQNDYSKELLIFEYTANAYESLLDQYTERFVIGKEGQEDIQNQIDVSVAYLEAIISGDKIAFLIAKQLESELLPEEDEQGESDLTRIIAILEKHLSVLIDPRKISVSKFYTHINLLIESGKKSNTDQRGN